MTLAERRAECASLAAGLVYSALNAPKRLFVGAPLNGEERVPVLEVTAGDFTNAVRYSIATADAAVWALNQ